MRLTAVCVVLIGSCISAQARTHALLNGTSPNGLFRVRAAQVDSSKISYDIVRTADSALLHRIHGSYQPEEGTGDWPWDESVDAEIYWSDDSRCVVIDEQVHNYIGTLFLVLLRHTGADGIPLPEQAILARTGLHWDKYRIRVSEIGAWSSPHHLSLSLAGQVKSGTLPDGRATYEHRTFAIDLHIGKRRATINTCRDTTKKA
jgi:hypothetical protein